jgi:nitronate monooxygenase
LSAEVLFSPSDLRVPLVQAPMAGGPSTPALAAAAARAGALGFLAGGYLTPEALARQIAEAQELAGPAAGHALGVNLFVPQPVAEPERIEAYRAELAASEADRYGVTLPEPDLADTDLYAEKLELLLDDPVPVVSFTFGLPDARTVTRFRQKGSYTVGTVTSADEAHQALAAGVDAICAPLDELFAQVRAVLGTSGTPLIAAGGLATAKDAARLRAAGAALTQHGTAFLRANEAGTLPVHRDALVDAAFAETVLTRAFSGRWVRTLRNGFVDRHPGAPAAYPAVNQMTRPLRTAAAGRGDTDNMSMYAGVNHAKAKSAPASRIIADLERTMADVVSGD